MRIPMFTMNEDRTSKEREDQEDAVPIPRHLVVVLDDNLSVLVGDASVRLSTEVGELRRLLEAGYLGSQLFHSLPCEGLACK